MNKFALILVLLAFSGTNVLAAGLPRLNTVNSEVEVASESDGTHLELTLPHFAGAGRGAPPGRGGNGGGNGR